MALQDKEFGNGYGRPRYGLNRVVSKITPALVSVLLFLDT